MKITSVIHNASQVFLNSHHFSFILNVQLPRSVLIMSRLLPESHFKTEKYCFKKIRPSTNESYLLFHFLIEFFRSFYELIYFLFVSCVWYAALSILQNENNVRKIFVIIETMVSIQIFFIGIRWNQGKLYYNSTHLSVRHYPYQKFFKIRTISLYATVLYDRPKTCKTCHLHNTKRVIPDVDISTQFEE